MNESGWIRLAPLSDCPAGQTRYVEAGGRDLAIFHLSNPDRIVVTNNSCPHAGGNLSAGQVENGIVTCPWHQWKFNLNDGRCTTAPNVRVRTYEARIDDGFIYARLVD